MYFLVKKYCLALILGIVAGQQVFACDPASRAFGESRTLSVDMTQSFGFGSMRGHKQLPLKDKEVVLTFDDGPWRGTTAKILRVLDKYCAHATFFPIGQHVKRYPEILRQVHQSGHTIGSHSWSHDYRVLGGNVKGAYADIMHGAHVIAETVNIPLPTFFRYPGFRERKAINKKIRKNRFVVFSSDVDSVDWRMKSADALMKRVFGHLKKKGKGILIFHDNKKLTANTLNQILYRLKSEGYKIVHVMTKGMMQMAKASETLKTVAGYPKTAFLMPKVMSLADRRKVASQIMPTLSLGTTPALFFFRQMAERPLFQNVYVRNIGTTLQLLLLLSWLSFKFMLYVPSGSYHHPKRRWG